MQAFVNFTKTMVNRLPPTLLAFLSILLLWLAWPTFPFTFLIFIAWVPLLLLESKIKKGKKFFGYTYLVMFGWNVSTTWWIINASVPGAIAAFFANSLIMCLPWMGYRKVKNHLGQTYGLIALVAFWMCFEYIHLLDWGLSWPWLTLGNVFAMYPNWIQWYEFTGVAGGSLWVLVLNVLIYRTFFVKQNKRLRSAIAIVAALALPYIISIVIHKQNEAQVPAWNVVVVQPNIDPYEKISEGTFDLQMDILLSQSESAVDVQTRLLIWPETALYTPYGIDEGRMKDDSNLNRLWDFLRKHPNVTLFTGMESYRIYDSRVSKTAKPIGSSDQFFESFNGSVLVNTNGPVQFYHKSMLVPGVETLPWFLRFIDRWFEKFGGTTAGYARQKERTVLQDPRYDFRIAPAICYESIYGRFMSKYIQNGANMIAIITNDGWWDDTPGYRQHMNYARIRAIETRKWVARSANTGISCFIDDHGKIYDAQPWDTVAAIKRSIPLNETKTFYVRFGDIFYYLAMIVSVAFLIFTFIRKYWK